MSTEPPTPPPLPPPPEPPASQPPIPPAPPPADFPTSTEAVEANWKTTAFVVWGVVGLVLLAGLAVMALTWRSAELPSLPDAPSFDLDMPQFRMPEIDRPTLAAEPSKPGSPMPEDMAIVDEIRTSDPVGEIDKPDDARSGVASPDFRPPDKAA